MGSNYFTEDQLEDLRANPYVEKVSKKSIRYTKTFKERFHEAYQSGKSPSQILSDMGIDPKVLGKKRRDSIVSRIKDYSLRVEGFKDLRSQNSGRLLTKDLTPDEQIKRLEQKITYLSQENEFLKKNIQMDREAVWEYKRRHQKNLN